jgi:hypothetical protein
LLMLRAAMTGEAMPRHYRPSASILPESEG